MSGTSSESTFKGSITALASAGSDSGSFPPASTSGCLSIVVTKTRRPDRADATLTCSAASDQRGFLAAKPSRSL
jgi:hypothetical protein